MDNFGDRIAEFWGCDATLTTHTDVSPRNIPGFVREIRLGVPLVLTFWKSNLINPATLWEICEHFKIKYPENKVKRKMSEMVLTEYRRADDMSSDIWFWANKYYSHNMEQLYSSRIAELLEVYTTCIAKMRESLDMLTPYMFQVSDKLLQLRYRALHSACLFEIRLLRAFISGIKASMAEHQQP